MDKRTISLDKHERETCTACGRAIRVQVHVRGDARLCYRCVGRHDRRAAQEAENAGTGHYPKAEDKPAAEIIREGQLRVSADAVTVVHMVLLHWLTGAADQYDVQVFGPWGSRRIASGTLNDCMTVWGELVKADRRFRAGEGQRALDPSGQLSIA